MRPVRLYVENFMCYERSFVDFTQFSSALIVGKRENNDIHSNGVGKTTIFQSIEYVLFNQVNFPLERVIRDDTNMCQVVFDFLIGSQEYRLIRKRTKKGTTDLSLFQRNATVGEEYEVYHTIKGDEYIPITDGKILESFWKDLSGRRNADTERELEKLIKCNYKAFESTVHFVQNDFTGLPTATPEKRKGILKEAFGLQIYAKLEKIAKDKSNVLSKDVDRIKLLIENLGDPEKELVTLKSQLLITDANLVEKQSVLENLNQSLSEINAKIIELTNSYSILEKKFSDLILKERVLSADKSRLEISVKEYHSKKNNVIKFAKSLMDEISALKNEQTTLAKLDYSQADILNEQISQAKERVTHFNIVIQNSLARYEELKIPVPDDTICKHCRQTLTEEHKKICKTQILEEMQMCQTDIRNAKKEIVEINSQILAHQQAANSINLSKQQLESINTKITAKNKEIQDKKTIHDEYLELLNKFTNELSEKTKELEVVQEEIKNSSAAEAGIINQMIEGEKQKVIQIQSSISVLNKELTHLNSTKAVIDHTIDQKTKDNTKLLELKKNLLNLEKVFGMYPHVLQAFSSAGISNIIIQNVLDDLQTEANNLLSQLRPGLQLSFLIEKTKGNGAEAETLDIKYNLNGKDRYYKQLSGAMQLAVNFSLKLGLSFLLQKLMGTDIRLLLLDEIDQSLDPATVDVFADIVKFFQKDFTILVITHNNRLKDKFSHAICVEQDSSMVSKAKVVSSW